MFLLNQIVEFAYAAFTSVLQSKAPTDILRSCSKDTSHLVLLVSAQVSGSLTDAPHRGDLPSPRRDSFGFEGHSSQAYPEHDPACNIEMQRQWSWS